MTPSPKSPPDPLLRRWGLTWAGWRDNRRGEWWLLAQVLLIAAHLLPPWPAPGAWGYAWPLPVAIAGRFARKMWHMMTIAAVLSALMKLDVPVMLPT